MELRMSSIPLTLEYVSGLASRPGDRETVETICGKSMANGWTVSAIPGSTMTAMSA